MNNFSEIMNGIIEQIMNDDDLQDEIKDELVKLVQDVIADPTPGNVEALSILMDKFADANKYLAAKTSLQGLKLKDDMELDSLSD